MTFASAPLYPNVSERSILWIVGVVQFINILDFMMVLPLGPDFARAFAISNTQLGWLGGSYTAASALCGILISSFIDRFDRKLALLTAVSGLMLATCLGGFAWSFNSLLVTRVVAGLCGGPATSIAWSIIADIFEPQRRGQAMGKVMGSFSLVAIVGVPFSLDIATHFGWRMPFFVISAIGLMTLAVIYMIMPAMKKHLTLQQKPVSLLTVLRLFTKPPNYLVYLYTLLGTMASFIVIPNLSAYVQFNLHYPREHLPYLYAAGGIVSFITLRMTGKVIDRQNPSFMSFISAFIFILTLLCVFVFKLPIPAIAFFMLFMFAMGMRNVSTNTLATRVPPPEDRAGFMSLFSCFQGMGMSLGAFFSTMLLSENADGSLKNMQTVAIISILLSFVVPVIMHYVEKYKKANVI